MRKLHRMQFADECATAQYPIRRLTDIPLELRKEIVELARVTANRRGKFLRDLLPMVMNFSGKGKTRELAILIEHESEIL